MPEQSIQMNLFEYFKDNENFTIAEANEAVLQHYHRDVKVPSIRARIYEGIDKGLFKRVAKGVYTVTKKDEKGQESTCMLINGDGRDLSMFEDNSVDAIITDHPYKLDKALKGGNRDFASYDLFKYEQSDFDEKLRVLKKGAFLLEFLPEESEINFEYLYQVKKMAIESGFKYFAKVPWKKGDWVANTGRTKKNREDIIFFSKGEPRALKLDTKKNKSIALENGLDVKGLDSYQLRDLLEENGLPVSFMKGPAGMLPTDFDFQPRGKSEKVMEAEKPVELFDAILPYITLPGEKVLDQFAGSGNLGISAVKSGRDAILIEKDEETFIKMKENIEESFGIEAKRMDDCAKENAWNEEDIYKMKHVHVPYQECKEGILLEYKGLSFDEWTIDPDTGGIWGEMCECCAEKYKHILKDELSGGGMGACSVKGCSNVGADIDTENHYYVDFKPELVKFVSHLHIKKMEVLSGIDEKIQEANVKTGAVSRGKGPKMRALEK